MKSRPSSVSHPRAMVTIVALFVTISLPTASFAQPKKKNPSSKVYISDVAGEAEIDTGENIQELNKRSVYTAEGTVIETKKADKDADKSKTYSTMVYSNGTGAYFDQDTRVEVKKFVQEPFTPNRGDMDVEPSISQTQAFVARGTVGLCTSKLVAGSSMNYQTAQADVKIRGQKVVIEAGDDVTKISMLDGDSTVQAGGGGTNGLVLKAGQQAIIRKGIGNAAPQIQVQNIPPSEKTQLDDKVAQACMAKKTVYFEVKERQTTNDPGATASTDSAAGSDVAGDTGSPSTNQPVTAFDDNTGAISTSNVTREIVAVPVVPNELPVQFTVSPATIPSTGRTGGG